MFLAQVVQVQIPTTKPSTNTAIVESSTARKLGLPKPGLNGMAIRLPGQSQTGVNIEDTPPVKSQVCTVWIFQKHVFDGFWSFVNSFSQSQRMFLDSKDETWSESLLRMPWEPSSRVSWWVFDEPNPLVPKDLRCSLTSSTSLLHHAAWKQNSKLEKHEKSPSQSKPVQAVQVTAP